MEEVKTKEFENLTIANLREMTERFKSQNPDVQTAEELLEELNTREKK